ncbi:NADH-quinone oxidoreductase subunit J [Buchnera aphidicola]|uniref:NADH-quinone oxidoreductase subunit J n=1 Tax=Buchnera aphidicola TaxID=9 RepID=UPI003BEF1FC3
MLFIFYTFSLIAIISTLLVIIQKNAIYSLLYLIISMLSISAIFFLLGAFFIGSLEAIIYAGAIMVLFVFVIMMLNVDSKSSDQEYEDLHPKFWILPSILSFILFCFMSYVILFLKNRSIYSTIIDSKMVGISLFGPYVLLVELLSMLLLSALVVVFHIGKEKNTKNYNNKKKLYYISNYEDNNL